MMAIETVTSPDGTGFSESTSSDPLVQLNLRLEGIEGILGEIQYSIEQIQERLHDIDLSGSGYGVDG